MARSPRRITISTLAMVCAVAVFAACSDRTGPGMSRVGQLGIAPRYQSPAAAVVDVAAVRVLLTSTFDERIALDTVIVFPAGQDSVSLGFAVALEQPDEEFVLFLRLIGPAGDTVFASGPDVVRPASGGASPTVVEPVLTYVGVGANAAAVTISSPDTTLFFGGAVVLQAVALDASQTAIPGTPIQWISLDPLVVVVPDADSGRVIAGTQRGTARIVARLLTGQTDTVRVVAQPVPGTIIAESGGGQTGPGGALLPQPLVARVIAADGLGVRGVWVRFAVTAGGGSLGADSVRTDSTGRASVTFHLGQTGPQTVQATTAGLAGQFPSFAATVQAGPPAAIAIVAGDGQLAIAGSNVAVAPRVVVTDSAGRPVSGAPVSFSVTQGGGSVAGATPVTGANGEAAVTGWTLGTVAAPNTLRAIVVRPPTDTFSVTFTATGIPGPASLLAVVSGDAQSDTAGATLALPLVVRATDANGNATGGVPIAWTATAGTLGDDTVATDGTGHAQVTWTLPTTVGSPGATARIVGTAVTRAFIASVLPATARRLVFVVQPSTVVQGAAIVPPVEVEVTDQFGNRRAADAGRTVAIAIGTNPGGASLGGTPTGSTVAGIAAFANLTVSAFGSGFTLVSTSAGLVPDTSTAFTVLSPPGRVFWTNPAGGNWSAGANWSSGAPPGSTDTAFVTLDGNYTVTLDANVTLAGLALGDSSGAQSLIGTARTLTLNGPGTVGANGVLSLTGGSVGGAGALTNQGQVTLLDVPVGIAVANAGVLRLRGTTALNGALSNAAGGEIRVEATGGADGNVTTAAGWTNAGTLVLSHGGGGAGQPATLTVNGTLVNDIGAVLRSEVGLGTFGVRALVATLDNRGVVDLQHDLALSRASAAHVNNGTITVAGGNLTVTQSGTAPSLTSTGTITVGAGRTLAITGGAFTNSGAGRLQGAGTLDVATTTFSNAGVVGPGLSPGVLTVTGNYPQSASGTLAIELGGPTPGTGHDQLVVSGAATLAGSLNVSLLGAFTPVLGQQFTVVTFASRTGDFTSVTLPPLAGGLDWQRTFSGTAMVLEVIPAAATPGVNAWSATASGLWSDATRWTRGRAPIPGDTVLITTAGSYTVTLDVDASVDSLVVGGASGTQTLDATGVRTLTLTGGATVGVSGRIRLASGDLTVGGGNVLALNGGAILVGAGRSFSLGVGGDGSGLTYVAGAVGGPGWFYLNADAQLNLAANLTLDSVNVGVLDGAVNRFTSERLIVGPGSYLKMVPTAGVNINTVLENRGTVDAVGPLNFVNDSVVNVTGAVLRVEAGDPAHASTQLTVAGGLRNAGTVELVNSNAASTAPATLQVTGGGLRNLAGGIVRSAVGGGSGGRTLDAVLDNQGTVAVEYPLTLARGSAAHVNDGTVRLTGGSLTIAQSGTAPSFTNRDSIVVGAGHTLTVAGGTFVNTRTPTVGVLAGTGTMDVSAAAVTNDGIVAPGLSPGLLAWTGAAPFSGVAALEIEIGGTTAGTQYDRLAVNGAATLGGTLTVALSGGFAPVGGEQFTVLTFASRTGDFATVNLPVLGVGLGWQRSVTATAMVLTVTNAFAGAPPGTDAVWTGAVSSSWTDAGNWAPGIPGLTDDVFIRADAANPLVVTSVRTVDSLTVQTGAIVTVSGTADTLVVGGSLAAGSPAIGGNGAVRLTGANQTARGQLANLAVTGTIAAGDSLLVSGSLAVSGGGDLNVGAQRVRVGGNVSTAGGATVTMPAAAGRLDVAGNATFGGGSTAGRLTDGTFRLAGGLTQSGDPQSFAPSGAHLTVLNGVGGALTFANPAPAGGSHFHHLSVLMSGTASNGGELVITGNLVVQDTAQFAPSGIVGGSGNRVTVVGSATISQSRTAAVLTSDVLRFGGAVNRNAGAVVDGDTVEFFGTNQTVPTNLSPAFALKVTGDSVLFAGSTTWRGMLVTGNGLADLGGATVAVDSTFRTTGNGRIRMTNPAAKLSVRGEARFEGGSTAGRMTAGTLDLGSHFSQAGITSPSSFAPSGTHLTQFRNFDYVPGNPSVVPVTISMSNTFASFFRNLLIDQEITATLPFHTVVTGSLTKPEFATLTGTALEVHGDLTASGALNGIIDLDTAYVGGVFTPNLSSQDYRITVLVMTGAAQTLPSFPHYATVVVEGDSVVLAGGADMLSLFVDGIGLADVGGNVQVYGSLETRGQGRLRMAGGSLFVGGNAAFGGGSTAGLLTGGTLTVGGGFIQTGANSAAAFAASAGHVTEFINFDFRAVDFASPDSLASHFGTLSLGGAGELRLVSDVYAVGQLRTPAPAGGVVRTLSGLNLQGTRLVARGVDVDSLDFKALHLVIADGAPIGRFRDVRFVDQDPGVDRLVVRRAGGSHTFERVMFTTAPDPGFAYVSVFDADGTAATPFNLTMDQPSPADPGSFTRTDGIATLTWAAGALLSGTVRNAVGGVEISGATVDLKQGPNAAQGDPTLLSTLTDAAGHYSFTGLTAGDYTLWVTAPGFIDGAVAAITVAAAGPTGVDVALSPLQQAGETRIVVSWGATPADLDSWLVVPDTVGGPPTYVSYGSRGASASYPFSQLDNDVTTGYGPETITIYQQLAGTYQFRVHDYGAGDNEASTTLLASEARVDVYQNNELVQTFTVPNAPGTLWTVFELNGGTITPINTMSGNSPGSAVAGAATQLAFTVQPSNTGAGATITPPVQVAALDAFGALATGFTGVVTVALGNGVLNGTTNVAAVGGVATFSDLSIDQPAPGYFLQAAVGSGGVQAAFSQFFDVTLPGQIAGTVRTAVDAVPIPGASVQLRQGANATTNDPVYQSTLTDVGGGYYFPVSEGQYTLFFGASGQITTRVAGVTVTAGQTTTVAAGLTPPLSAGRTRVVLSWGGAPPELDAHLLGPDGLGGEFHVYYGTPGDSVASPFAVLHQDVGNGQGPEAVTIYAQQAGVYEFRVHDWVGGADPADSVLRTSGARVDVFQGTQQVQSFTVPYQLGTLWKVFQMTGTTITALNTIVGDPPATPTGGGGFVTLGLGDGASLNTSGAPRLGPPRTPR